MADVHAALKSLQNDLSEVSLRHSLQQFMAWIQGKSEPLAKCFEKEYTGRTREWAACLRVGSSANTNMFVERFHRTKKQTHCIDHLIFKLRQLSWDKASEQLIKAEKGKNTETTWNYQAAQTRGISEEGSSSQAGWGLMECSVGLQDRNCASCEKNNWFSLLLCVELFFLWCLHVFPLWIINELLKKVSEIHVSDSHTAIM